MHTTHDDNGLHGPRLAAYRAQLSVNNAPFSVTRPRTSVHASVLVCRQWVLWLRDAGVAVDAAPEVMEPEPGGVGPAAAVRASDPKGTVWPS